MAKTLIVAINGSPRADGNTAFLLLQAINQCIQMGAATEIIHCQSILKDQKTPYCMACTSPCTGKCYKDKELAKAYEILSRADGIIAGSPVYFGTVSAQLKSFWDKSRKLRAEKKLLNVVGGALACGGSRFGGQETTLRAIHDMFLVQGMIIVGDGYHENDCGHMGVAAQRPADGDANAIERNRILTKRIIQVAEATRALRTR
ncbi:MAG: flavodoxin family protein [Syntrophomonadaceae bacterium]|nr:flavodoxin family protein [Syntrophomonadaceae bacterium]MDD3889093.1 flavodoxin family protein [Syntrophomonadaceae bacterium]MDD4549503.1 flavodoxin family protein [Syntrophomonadaceae bacterium]